MIQYWLDLAKEDLAVDSWEGSSYYFVLYFYDALLDYFVNPQKVDLYFVLSYEYIR